MAQASLVSISIDPAQRRMLLDSLNPKQYRAAAFQAVKRTTAFAVKRVKAVVKEQAYISKKYLDRAVSVQTPTKGDEPVGIVRVRQDLIPLIAFKTQSSKRTGVTFITGPGRPTIHLRHAFKATVTRAGKDGEHAGHKGIFARLPRLHKDPEVREKHKGKLTPKGYAGRLPIAEQFGPSVLDIISVPKVLNDYSKEIGERMDKEVNSQLDRFLKPKT